MFGKYLNISHKYHMDILSLNWLLASMNFTYVFYQTSDTLELFLANITMLRSLMSCPYGFSECDLSI